MHFEGKFYKVCLEFYLRYSCSQLAYTFCLYQVKDGEKWKILKYSLPPQAFLLSIEDKKILSVGIKVQIEAFIDFRYENRISLYFGIFLPNPETAANRILLFQFLEKNRDGKKE